MMLLFQCHNAMQQQRMGFLCQYDSFHVKINLQEPMFICFCKAFQSDQTKYLDVHPKRERIDCINFQ